MKNLCIVFAVACLLMAPMVFGEDTPQPVRRGYEPHPKVTTTVLFPQSETNQFQIGKPVDVLIGFANDADVPLNVTLIGASLIYPYDWRVVIQNFTRLFVGDIVQPGERASFHYMFFPDPMLEPKEFGLTGRIAYQSVGGANNYTSVFFNETITLYEISESMDAQTFFTWIGVLGFVGLGGYMLFKSMTQKKKRGTRVETGTRAVYDDDWLEGTSAKKSKKGQQPQQQQQNKAKKN